MYKSTAFAAVSLVLFFFSVIFVSGALNKNAASTYNNGRKLATLLAVDTISVYLLLSSRTATGTEHDALVTMAAAGYANALYAFSTTVG